MTIFVYILGIIAVVWVVWRYAARRWQLPFPAWMVPLIESRLLAGVLNADKTLECLGAAPGMKVLDAGCGSGRLTVPLAETVGPGGLVVAFDMQQTMLAKLDEKIRAKGLVNIRPVLGGLGQGLLREYAGFFDRAICVAVLGEITDRYRAATMKEIYDALTPGGLFTVTEVMHDPHYVRVDEVRRLAESAGFRLVRRCDKGISFTATFSKPQGGTA